MAENRIKNNGIFLTGSQAAQLLNLSKTTLNKMIVKKKIRWFKTPGGHFRIHRDDLLKIAGQESEVVQ